MAKNISIKDTGPIKELIIDPKPGVTCLVGENGAGKSKALEAVDALTGGGAKLKPRDGTLGGEVSGFGIRISVGHSARRFGDPEFVSLGDKLDVAALVDPGLKSPEANDAARIKALVGLTGVTADAQMFYELVGGQELFESIVKKNSIVPDDPVEMARRIKKDLEEASRLEQSQADHAQGHADAKKESAKAFGEQTEPRPEAELQAEFRDAVSRESKLQSLVQQSAEAKVAKQRAKESYLEASKSYDGPTVPEAAKALESASLDEANAQLAVNKAREALESAQSTLTNCTYLRRGANDRLESAKQAIALCEKWEKQIAEIVDVAEPSAEEMAKAASDVATARQAIENAVVARKAHDLLAEAEAAAQEAKGHQERADRLRNSAKATDSVLSKLITKAGGALRVVGTEKGPRLVTTTDRAADTLYADLSDGQRWRMAMEIGLDTFKRLIAEMEIPGTPIFPLPQRAWQDLNPANRQPIADLARERGVCILTARCDDGPLRIEVM